MSRKGFGAMWGGVGGIATNTPNGMQVSVSGRFASASLEFGRSHFDFDFEVGLDATTAKIRGHLTN